MIVPIQETIIKRERYEILAKTLECALNHLGYDIRISTDTELKDVGRGPETFVNFRFNTDD